MARDGFGWQACPLHVEDLALGAVEDACSAVRALAARRGVAVDVATSPELVGASFGALGHLRIDGRAAEGWAPLSGFAEAADGWVRLHGNYPHHAAAITTALGATSRPELRAAVARMTAQDVEDAVLAAGGIATVVRSPAEWNEHPHGRHTAGAPWRHSEPGGARRELPAADRPLSGVRVLDLTRVIAGPTCSQLLACLGADVLRIDPPHRPERPGQYLSNGMGKRSVEADLARVAGTLRTELLPRADVVLLGYRPGALARFGLDAPALRAEHPGLVIGSLSAWGEDGPWGARPGFDSIVQAASGIAVTCGGSDGVPGALPVQALDHATGYALAADVMSLLAEARAGSVHANLLGAARTLLAQGSRRRGDVVPVDVPTVRVGSPHGNLVAVPPPITLDRRTIEREVGGYGAAELAW